MRLLNSPAFHISDIDIIDGEIKLVVLVGALQCISLSGWPIINFFLTCTGLACSAETPSAEQSHTTCF